MNYFKNGENMSELFTELPIGKFFENMVEKQPDHEFIIYPDRNLSLSFIQIETLDLLIKNLMKEWTTLQKECSLLELNLETV